MSLLIEALRKAEEQKRRQGAEKEENPRGTATDDAPGLGLELLTAAAEKMGDGQRNQRLPDLPLNMEDLDEQFMSGAPPVPPTAPVLQGARSGGDAPAGSVSREAARNLFDVKQPAPASNRAFVIGIGAFSALAVVAIGGYFWWQLQPQSGLVPGRAALVQAPAAAPPVSAPPPQLSPPPDKLAVPPAPTFPVASATPVPVSEPTVQAKTTPGALAGAASVRPPAVAEKHASADGGASPPIRVGRSALRVDPLLEQAYEAFRGGQYEVARQHWQKMLANDALNADALHGLANLALQQKRFEEAAEAYRRILEGNPKDARAQAGMVSLRAAVDPVRMESHLKTLLAEQSESPYLNFALGNLYAQNQRWTEAQNAFFRAHAADPENPDYLFNLAVSLDQIRQPRLALQYYQRALTAVRQQGGSFDIGQAEARIALLQADRQP